MKPQNVTRGFVLACALIPASAYLGLWLITILSMQGPPPDYTREFSSIEGQLRQLREKSAPLVAKERASYPVVRRTDDQASQDVQIIACLEEIRASLASILDALGEIQNSPPTSAHALLRYQSGHRNESAILDLYEEASEDCDAVTARLSMWQVEDIFQSLGKADQVGADTSGSWWAYSMPSSREKISVRFSGEFVSEVEIHGY